MPPPIKTYQLDKHYLFVHKEDLADTNFGMDNTPDLIEGGFGLYSSVKVKQRIGPLKSQFYRIGFCRQGSLEVNFGLDTYTHTRNSIHFNFPGQLFTLDKVSADMYSLYILFTAAFMEPLMPSPVLQAQYPFLDYAGVPFFRLSDEEAIRMEQLFREIDAEIKTDNPDKATAIRHFVGLILVTAARSYHRQQLTSLYHNGHPSTLVMRYKKLVEQYFIQTRAVASYAQQLGVTPRHLSKVIREETGKTPSDFIDEMLMMEIKSLLRHSDLSISEIAYQLDFSDPPHLTNFFKKHQGYPPASYRKQETY